MGGDVPRSEYSLDLTDPQRVREIVQAIEALEGGGTESRDAGDARPVTHSPKAESV
jgi:hypothetical protein